MTHAARTHPLPSSRCGTQSPHQAGQGHCLVPLPASLRGPPPLHRAADEWITVGGEEVDGLLVDPRHAHQVASLSVQVLTRLQLAVEEEEGGGKVTAVDACGAHSIEAALVQGVEEGRTTEEAVHADDVPPVLLKWRDEVVDDTCRLASL
jgi:hypothetical protein